MSPNRTLLISLALGLLVAAPGGAESPSYFLFRAAPLGFPAEAVVARVEVRDDYRILSSERIVLEFAGADQLLVKLGSSPPAANDRSGGWRLLVFAGDLLVGDFDRSNFAAYQRSLEATRAADIAALESWRDAKPGLVQKALCEPSPCGGGCSPSQDYDCDGINNANDNCTDVPNYPQDDCDGDDFGDACDGTNGIFQATGSVKTCMTDKDTHVGYFEFEHHVEQRLVDVSSCGSPDRWNRWIRSDAQCFNLTDHFCCINGIGSSIIAVGDSESLWCGGSRNIDFCN